MNKEQILKLASEYQEFLDLIIRAVGKKDPNIYPLMVRDIDYLGDGTGILVVLRRPGQSAPVKAMTLTYEELEQA